MSKSKDLIEIIQAQEKVAIQFGFYWESLQQLLDQIRSECSEVEEAYNAKDKKHLQEEVGDIMNASVSLAIFCGLDPHQVLEESTVKFQKRYDIVVKLAQKDGFETLEGQPLHVLMKYWNQSKSVKEIN